MIILSALGTLSIFYCIYRLIKTKGEWYITTDIHLIPTIKSNGKFIYLHIEI